MAVNEHEFEPVPGLPEELPENEHILWQGAPDWRVLARRAFHLRILLVYFALLLIVRMGTLLAADNSLTLVLGSTAFFATLGIGAAGLFTLYAWLIARTTLYTITNRRLVMRFGIALPMTVNLPFSRVQSAAVKAYADGTGDIPVTLDSSHRVSSIVMWPHVRPWKFGRPEPMLRGIPDARQVAELLADAASSIDPAMRPDLRQSPEAEVDHGQVPAMAMGEAR